MIRLSVLLAALALAACNTDGTSARLTQSSPSSIDVADNTPPKISQTIARRLIASSRSRLFKDAPSIRDARISQPFTCYSLDGDCICAEVNAKNSFGGYTGAQLIGFRFSSDEKTVEGIGEMGEKARDGACGRLSPFPELNGKR